MSEFMHFVVDPWWQNPFRRDPAYRRHLLLYRVVRKPIGADWSETELMSRHWTRKQAIGMVRILRAITHRSTT